jgi:predicted transcriptional regulator
MNPKNFGKNLNKVLDCLEMSQIELAKKTGLTQAAISQIINGQREPSLSTIVKILKIIPTNFERLVGE